MATGTYFYGLGRRKSSTVTARLYHGKGNITINGKSANDFFNGNAALVARITDPLALVGKQNEYDITLLAKGGGTTGQVDASRLAIAKALASINDELRTTLSKAGYLHRDSREVERKKYGLKGARRKEQFSKRYSAPSIRRKFLQEQKNTAQTIELCSFSFRMNPL